jgi:hypothetical protein
MSSNARTPDLIATSQVLILITIASRKLAAIIASRHADNRIFRTRLKSHIADGQPSRTIITMI